MAVNWSELQAREVEAILATYPAVSNRCEICATKIRAIGVAVDPDAHCFSVRPVGRERFVVPKTISLLTYNLTVLMRSLQHRELW